MPTRHSLFWRLAVLVGGFCLAMIWATQYFGIQIRQAAYLSEEARGTLRGYAEEAEAALQRGLPELQAWLNELKEHEPGRALVVDRYLQPLSDRPLGPEELRHLNFVRHYEWPLSRRRGPHPLVAVPLATDGNQLLIQVPERFLPWKRQALLTALNLYLIPLLISLLFCGLLYSMLMRPLRQLKHQAQALRATPMDTLLSPELARRRDEMGDLARALDYLTARLRGMVVHQRQLLWDLSHELRTPMSRLRVACESALDADELRARIEREAGGMQHLVDAVLELAWLDSEQPHFACEPVDVATLWDLLCEDACFESGWPRERLQADLPDNCQVLAHLNTLAHAMENILRNAIRYSPPDGVVKLTAQHQGSHWLLCIRDEGPGVPEEHLETIFKPFARLNAERPGDGGYGLGLAIAQRLVQLQGGTLHARNGQPGLCQCICLESV